MRASTLDQTNFILDSLVEDAAKRIPELDLPDPYVVLSGDLAYGGREEEYKFVDSFVDTIKRRLRPRKVEYCGGNHDVNWSLLASFNADLMNGMVERPNSILDTEKRFALDTDRLELQKGMGPYYSFLERHGVKSSSDLYYVDSTGVSGLKVNFISLNSAYIFSRKYNYHGYIGNRQMEDAFQLVEKDDSPSFNVTIVHHPHEALVPVTQEDSKRALLAHSDVILNGHVHSPRMTVEYSAGLLGRTKRRPPPVISCSHCVFDEANDPSITSGYYIIGVDFEYEKVKQIKVWEIEFDKVQKKWYHDPKKNTYPLTVSVGTPDQIGNKVIDAEKQLLTRWKRSTPGG